jgi:ataxia telangiectasia mutated family protein
VNHYFYLTNCVATHNVFLVGHILGIGDRHTSNILVHTKTGELVHIDFGYVFEQAKVSVC